MARSLRLLASALALAACSPTTHVITDYDRGTRLSGFHSFTLITRPHPGTGDPLVVQRTSDAIVAELTSRGFAHVLDPAEADLAVDFTVGADDRLDVRSAAAPVAGPWFHGGSWGSQIEAEQYQEGTLAIDVFDARSRRAVWHGSAGKRLSQSDLANSHAVIREAVTAVLAGFPPKEG
jgi:uncharacterized protein DUF4136